MDTHQVIINGNNYTVFHHRQYTAEEEKFFDYIYGIFIAEFWDKYFKAALARMGMTLAEDE